MSRVYKCGTRLALPLHKFVFVLLANHIVRTVFFLFQHYSGSAVASQFTSCELNGSRCISSCKYPSDSRHSHRPFTDSKAFTVPSAVDPREQGSTSRRVEISGPGNSRIHHRLVESCACDAGYGFFYYRRISFGCQFFWKLSGWSFCISRQCNCLLLLLVRAVYPTMMRDVDEVSSGWWECRKCTRWWCWRPGKWAPRNHRARYFWFCELTWFNSQNSCAAACDLNCVCMSEMCAGTQNAGISSYHYLASFPYAGISSCIII